MATTMIINQHTERLSVEDKARLLHVFEIGEEGRLAVTSGTHADRAYVVHHDDRHVTYCPCDARTPRCSHAIAGNWFLANRRRAFFDILFNPNNIA